jgi:hypothetical protein
MTWRLPGCLRAPPRNEDIHLPNVEDIEDPAGLEAAVPGQQLQLAVLPQ